MAYVYGVFTYDPSDREVSDIVAFINNMMVRIGPSVRFSVGYSESEGEEFLIAADTVIEDADSWAEKYITNNRQSMRNLQTTKH
ncbi:hypothetical protein [Alicyclobacillus fodiniaquatilis]|uniref:GGDEF domain-containing protein n=1 Tax=Alicyclobacillus fodiniaquatilis TaxID=1661150 RepID=A0ABW4JHD9_9BACL